MRGKPCAACHHPKSRHRTRECRHTWKARGQTFMGISTITKWCTCTGYEAAPEPADPWPDTEDVAAAHYAACNPEPADRESGKIDP